jgi:predicted PolB exonuclease-like 3'-5' exonuclease
MLFFDIETEGNPDAVLFMENPTAPSNYKDPEKIVAYIEKKKEEQIEKAALDPDYGKIIAIGVKGDENPISSMLLGHDFNHEKDLLQAFWQMYVGHGGFVCGYNILGFDLPYLMRRSFDLGLKPNTKINLYKYQTSPALDLMALLYNWSQAKSMKWVAERYSFDNPLPNLDGSQVKNMDAETLRKYVENDVYLVYQLFNRMRGIYF